MTADIMRATEGKKLDLTHAYTVSFTPVFRSASYEVPEQAGD